MPLSPSLLASLTHGELLAVVDRFGILVPDRRSHQSVADTLARANIQAPDLLGSLSRDRLKELCQALGLEVRPTTRPRLSRAPTVVIEGLAPGQPFVMTDRGTNSLRPRIEV